MSDWMDVANLRNFIYQQIPMGYVFEASASYVTLGDEQHEFYVWAWHGDEPELLVDQFKRDIEAWVEAAGPKATIVVRHWPEMEPEFEGTYRLYARMLIVNQFYHSVLPPFMPKKEGDETPLFGGSDGD